MRYVVAPLPDNKFQIVDTHQAIPDRNIVAVVWLPLYVVQAMARTLNAHARLAELLGQTFPAPQPRRRSNG